MTLNILFLTITIKKRQYSEEEIIQQQFTKKIQDENKDRKFSMYRMF